MQSNISNSLANVEEKVQLQIFITARGLRREQYKHRPCTYINFYFGKDRYYKKILLGKTETVDDNLNPSFQKTFVVDYLFQTKQQITFEVMIQRREQTDPKKYQMLSQYATSLGELAGARNQTSILNLTKPDRYCLLKQNYVSAGKLIVRVQPFNSGRKFLKMKWRADQLLKTSSWFNCWGKTNPYLKFLKIRTDNTFIQAVRSQIAMKDLNPSWRQFEVSETRLVREDNQEQKFKVQCWSWEEKGETSHKFIGEVFLTVSEITNERLPISIPLNNPNNKNAGTLVLQRLIAYEKHSFIDYLRGGLQLNLSVAIDFTGSNGSPLLASSLHCISSNTLNHYQTTITEVGNILLDYDYDKLVPAFGFGAKTNFPTLPKGTVNHCFPLSGRQDDIQAAGLDGLMAMYENAIKQVQLSGPTYFGPLLQNFVHLARKSMNEGSQAYQILLILTDGEIHDMNKTVDLIVSSSDLPLSIIIVGVGYSSFANMRILDGDDGLFDSKGRKANRDMVQFLSFVQFAHNSDLLARKLLAKLPGQVVQYMTMMGIAPGKKAEMNIKNWLVEDSLEVEEKPYEEYSENDEIELVKLKPKDR